MANITIETTKNNVNSKKCKKYIKTKIIIKKFYKNKNEKKHNYKNIENNDKI